MSKQFKRKILKSVIPESDLKLSQIIGLEEAKAKLKRAMLLMLKNDRPQTMLLLEGKSGTCKTTLVRAMVRDVMKKYPDSFLYVELGTADLTLHVTTTAKTIIDLWERMRKSKKMLIIFIDEADEVVASRKGAGHIIRERTVNIMKQTNDEIVNSLFIFASNTPSAIDGAMLSRFTSRIVCSLPTNEEIRKIIDVHLSFISNHKRDALHKQIIENKVRWSGRDIKLFANTLREVRDYNRMDDPDYKLTPKDIATEYRYYVLGKAHQKDDYLDN